MLLAIMVMLQTKFRLLLIWLPTKGDWNLLLIKSIRIVICIH